MTLDSNIIFRICLLDCSSEQEDQLPVYLLIKVWLLANFNAQFDITLGGILIVY